MGCGATWVSLQGWGAGQPGFPCKDGVRGNLGFPARMGW